MTLSGRIFHSRKHFDAIIFGILVVLITACAMPLDPPRSAPARRESPVPVSSSHRNGSTTDVMILQGSSIWMAEVQQLAEIIENHHSSFKAVHVEELNAMSLEEILSFSLLVVPGGYAPDLTESLTSATRARLRHAVQALGLDYLGFCAGAWIAISPAPAPNKDVSYGIGVVDGPIQKPNYLEKQGLEFALTRAIFPDGRRKNLLWYGGPITPELPGGVIARYADGTPAITQIDSGRGLVIVSGLHPGINSDILEALEIESAEAIDHELAWKLIRAGILHERLPAF